jgi:hypothetical protein
MPRPIHTLDNNFIANNPTALSTVIVILDILTRKRQIGIHHHLEFLDLPKAPHHFPLAHIHPMASLNLVKRTLILAAILNTSAVANP